MNPRLFTLSALAAASALTIHADQVDLSAGLVAQYNLNGNAADSSGNGNNGTIVGGLTTTTNQQGTPGGALAFDKDGYVAINNELLLNGATSAAITGWFNDQLPQGQNGVVIGAGDARAGLDPFVLFLNGDQITQAIFTDCSRGPYSPERLVGFEDPQYYTTIQENTWIPFVFEFSALGGETDFQMYLNGQLAMNLTFGWDAKIDYDIPMPVEIGALTGFQDVQFDGGIDDVRFYDRTLDLGEIQTLAQAPDSTSTGLLFVLAFGLIVFARKFPIGAPLNSGHT